ncbi:TrmH family RNA methyltransferase [Patescibacteria group bacterium]|nr:TrmH family RNA methyltransferase [Patescibacteria group bacterium]
MNLTLIAHNIRSAENIGSLLRTADAIGVEQVYITGYSPNIDHPKVQKTALGAELSVLSSKQLDVLSVIKKLKQAGYLIVGLEIDPRAESILEFHTQQQKIALLLGNEVEGITSYLLDECDKLVYIPQHGVKESLNVTIAAAIASYQLLNNNKYL